jgi:hypothetical protein
MTDEAGAFPHHVGWGGSAEIAEHSLMHTETHNVVNGHAILQRDRARIAR